MIHDFHEDLKRGQEGEEYLDEFFKEYVVITKATPDEQKTEIDRHFFNPRTNKSHPVEYKTDWKAAETHNAFVETVSVDTSKKPGWAYMSKASHLIYRIPGDGEVIYIIRFSELRKKLPDWVKSYPEKPAKNKGYLTYGLLVPLWEFEQIAERVF